MTWVESKEPWHRTQVAYCEVTGQLLPPRHWEFEDAGRTIRARDPHCEELYRRYLEPRRRDAGKGAGAAGGARRATP